MIQPPNNPHTSFAAYSNRLIPVLPMNFYQPQQLSWQYPTQPNGQTLPKPKLQLAQDNFTRSQQQTKVSLPLLKKATPVKFNWESNVLAGRLPGLKLSAILGMISLVTSVACVLLNRQRYHRHFGHTDVFHPESFYTPPSIPNTVPEARGRRSRVETSPITRTPYTNWDEEIALLLQAQERFNTIQPRTSHRFNLSRHHFHAPSTQSIEPLQTAQLPQAVRQKIDDLRTLLQTRPNELVDIFINNRRGRSTDSEFCFSFEDSDRFPEPFKMKYDMGQVDFFIPAHLIPDEALVSKEHLGAWLNLSPLPSHTPLRVQ